MATYMLLLHAGDDGDEQTRAPRWAARRRATDRLRRARSQADRAARLTEPARLDAVLVRPARTPLRLVELDRRASGAVALRYEPA